MDPPVLKESNGGGAPPKYSVSMIDKLLDVVTTSAEKSDQFSSESSKLKGIRKILKPGKHFAVLTSDISAVNGECLKLCDYIILVTNVETHSIEGILHQEKVLELAEMIHGYKIKLKINILKI